MKPPIAYYGGKTRLADWIVSLLPPHRVYVEPFCGSAAVLFAKRPATHEVINDLDGDLVCFLRVLRSQPEELERVCRLTPYARDEYNAADLAELDIDDVERARRWWVRSSQSFAQVAKVGTGWSTSVQRGSNNARSVWNRLDRFTAAAARLGPVSIENRDALEVIQAFDVDDGAMYVDAPYLGSTRSAIAGGRRPNGDYFCEFASDAQHTALAEVLVRARAAVVVSGYPSALYDQLYEGWWRADRQVLCRAANGRSSRNFRRTEVLWANRPLADGRLWREERW